MFDARLRRILSVLAGMYLVFLGRVFFLQTWGKEEARTRVSGRLNDEVPIAPRRGSILDGTGRVLARDAASFDLVADAWELGAVEWECGGCFRLVTTHERDPGPGPEGLPPLPPERPDPCRKCEKPGDRWSPTYGEDRLAAAALLGMREDELADALGKARLRSWVVARARCARLEGKSRAHDLRDFLSRPRTVRREIPREAALEIERGTARFRGMRVEARARRVSDDGLPPALRVLLGRTGPLQEDEWDRRGEELEAEGLSEELAKRTPFGRGGVEALCDRDLRGSFGRESAVRDLMNRTVSREVLVPAYDGTDVRLTLDAGLCAEAERILGGRPGALVALDPATGAVIALAGVRGEEPFLALEAVQALDPGSVMKTFTALVGLEGGLVPEAGDVTCTGRSSKPVGCTHVHGTPGLHEALAHSCNPFFGTLAIRIGTRPLERYGRLLGLAEPARIGVPPESGGTEWSEELARRIRGTRWERQDLANLGIGQGPMLMSPLQVAMLYAAVANGGWPVAPFLVEGKGTPPGEPVFSPESIAAVRSGLEETVRSGTASDAGLRAARAAGKTGTAQITGDRTRRGLYNAWFAAYAPSEAPRIVVVAVIEGTPESGGAAAAPPVAEFLRAWGARGGGR